MPFQSARNTTEEPAFSIFHACLGKHYNVAAVDAKDVAARDCDANCVVFFVAVVNGFLLRYPCLI